ncbi:hypothetical protein QBC42DRAFT_322277 [Cladorrhinum samala]|uniref:Secreted LysM effector LysM C-terminal domain-containing protein n=1 Tax=Cladorrhinum samala TaxID=585594 RepID=A0AAV9H9I5_9PEZI|nr:hypothetical protein QBC42DRAFT_322277 [Cladorrhinum samala]
MQFSTLFLATLSILSSGASSWQLAAYMDVEHCDVQRNSAYRVLDGPSNLNNCFTFQQSMPGTGCRAFTNGGALYGTCTSPGPSGPISVQVRGTCTIYSQANCQGISAVVGNRQCGQLRGEINILPYSIIRSYKCSGE